MPCAVTTMVTQDLYERTAAEAERRFVSMSAILRWALIEYMNRYEVQT
jgi:hypothetical protein